MQNGFTLNVNPWKKYIIHIKINFNHIFIRNNIDVLWDWWKIYIFIWMLLLLGGYKRKNNKIKLSIYCSMWISKRHELYIPLITDGNLDKKNIERRFVLSIWWACEHGCPAEQSGNDAIILPVTSLGNIIRFSWRWFAPYI